MEDDGGMGGRTRIDVRPPEGFFEMTEEQQLEWIRAFIAEAVATMDAMPDDD
jgi:hypothetical protein